LKSKTSWWDSGQAPTIGFSVLIASIFVASLMSTMLLIIPRGLDLTDEALYVLNAKFPKNLEFGSSYYHVFTSYLWNLSGNLLGFRLFGLAIVLFSGIVIALSVWGMLEPTKQTWMHLTLFISASGIFSLVYGTLLNYSPSYNQLVLLFGSIALSITFVQSSGIKRANHFLLWLSFDAAMIFVLLSKPSAFFPLWFLCFYSRISTVKRSRNLYVNEIINLAFCGVFVYFMFNTWLKSYLDLSQLGRGLEVLRELQQVSPARLLIQNMENLITNLLITLGLSLVIFFLVRANLKKLQRFSMQSQFLIIYSSVIVLSLGWLGGSDRWRNQSISLHLGLLVLFYLVFAKTQISKRESVQYLTLLLFPYMLSIGTNNLYFSQVLFYCASWGLLMILLVLKLSSVERYAFCSLGLCVLMCTTVFAQQVTYLGRNSYGLLQPLILNTKAVSIPGIGALWVDSQSKNMIEDAIQAKELCNLSGDEILISANEIGGLNLVLNLQPAGAAWIRGIRSLNLVSYEAINADSPNVLWAFRASDSSLRLDFSASNPTLELKKCAEISLGSREIIELWRQN
jgi:hypothetical protein